MRAEFKNEIPSNIRFLSNIWGKSYFLSQCITFLERFTLQIVFKKYSTC